MIFWDIFTMKRRGNRYFLVSRDWVIGILPSYTYRDIKSDFQALFNILLYFYLIWKLLQFYGVQYIELFFLADCEGTLYENSRIHCSFCKNVIDTIKIWILQEISSHFFWAPSLYWFYINVILRTKFPDHFLEENAKKVNFPRPSQTKLYMFWNQHEKCYNLSYGLHCSNIYK